MSRTFELLHRAELERETARARAVVKEPPRAAQAHEIAAANRRTQDEAQQACIGRLTEQVFFVAGPGAPHVVVFCGVEAHGHQNHVSAQVGQALAVRTRMPVCVVDANVSAPSVHSYFQVENHCGLMDALKSGKPLRELGQAVQAGEAKLTVVPTGRASAEWQGLVSSDAMAAEIAELRDSFEYVLIQAGPLAQFTHGIFLGRLADGLVMTIEANATRREKAKKIKEELARANVRLLGAVLNNRTYPIPEALYSRLW